MKMDLRMALLFAALVNFGYSLERPMGISQGIKKQSDVPGFIGDIRFANQRLEGNSGRRIRRNTATNLWPNAVIPYQIDCSLENMPNAISSIKAAMAEWENKTCIRFVKHTNERDHLTFFRGKSCYGDIGRLHGGSFISLGHNCDFQHVMAHEIGHAIGFHHEQNRADRDKYVKVQWDNIIEGDKRQFRKLNKSSSFGQPYDYSSIMHYSWKAFSKNGKETIQPLKDAKKHPYRYVSKRDAILTNLMYNCAEHKVRRKRSFGDCDDKLPTCKIWAKAGYCSTSTHVKTNCERSCKAPQCDKNSQPLATISTGVAPTTSKPSTTIYRKKGSKLGNCRDKRKGCRTGAKRGLCSRSKSFLALCPRNCHPKCRKVWCSDRRKMCRKWMKLGYCKLSEVVMQFCPQSCNPLCKDGGFTVRPQKTTTRPQPTTNPEVARKKVKCTDKREECKSWAKWGHCTRSTAVKKLCSKSCHPSCKQAQPLATISTGVAPTTSKPSTTIYKKKVSKIGNCRDKRKGCRTGAKRGLCSRSKSFLALCPRNCHPKCRKVWCSDRRKMCRKWMKLGYCKLSEVVMQFCPQSCNPLCKDGGFTVRPQKTTTRPQPTTNPEVARKKETSGKRKQMGVGILCKDKDLLCPQWARNNQCLSNKIWMGKNCQWSCNRTDCDRLPVRPSGYCSNPLGIGYDGNGSKIPDSSMLSTSVFKSGDWTAAPENARLYFEDDKETLRIGAWCAKSWHSKMGPFLQIDLGRQKMIQYIATQGRHLYFERVEKFQVKYSNDNSTWFDYYENGEVREFEGNCDHFTPILNTFNNIIKARHFRFYPTKANYPCARLELYGC